MNVELCKATVENLDLNITINWILLLIIIIAILFMCKYKFKNKCKNLRVQETTIKIPGFETKIQTTYEVKQIAYALWTELQTRKLGLEIDFEHDVIVEIYDSWYTFFSITRDLIKSIPVDKVLDENTQQIIKIAMKVLNESVRKHLTTWQARFRKWYTKELELEKGKEEQRTPQEIQRDFKINDEYRYEKLKDDMKKVNNTLIEYKSELEKIIFDKKF